MTLSTDQRIDQDLGSRLGELCTTLGALSRRAERALGAWIACPDREAEELKVAQEALHRMHAQLDRAGETFAWVEEALGAEAPASDGDRSD